MFHLVMFHMQSTFQLKLTVGLSRTVARKSSISGLYVCAGGLCVRAGGLDIQI